MYPEIKIKTRTGLRNSANPTKTMHTIASANESNMHKINEVREMY